MKFICQFLLKSFWGLFSKLHPTCQVKVHQLAYGLIILRKRESIVLYKKGAEQRRLKKFIVKDLF